MKEGYEWSGCMLHSKMDWSRERILLVRSRTGDGDMEMKKSTEELTTKDRAVSIISA